MWDELEVKWEIIEKDSLPFFNMVDLAIFLSTEKSSWNEVLIRLSPRCWVCLGGIYCPSVREWRERVYRCIPIGSWNHRVTWWHTLSFFRKMFSRENCWTPFYPVPRWWIYRQYCSSYYYGNQGLILILSRDPEFFVT